MSLVQVGQNIYANINAVRAVGPIVATPPPQGGSVTYTFQILLDGSVLSIGGSDQALIDSERSELVSSLNSSHFMTTGGFDVNVTEVEGIGPVTTVSATGPDEHPIVKFGYDLHVEGNVAKLVFNTIDEAEASVNAVVTAVNG